MLARLSPTTASAANPLPAHLRGMGSVPRGRLSLSSCLLLVSFCSTTVAREASSSSSCHWLIWFMLTGGRGLREGGVGVVLGGGGGGGAVPPQQEAVGAHTQRVAPCRHLSLAESLCTG